MCRILDPKYKKSDLDEVMTKQCQKHLTTIEHYIFLHILKKFKDMFDGTLGT